MPPLARPPETLIENAIELFFAVSKQWSRPDVKVLYLKNARIDSRGARVSAGAYAVGVRSHFIEERAGRRGRGNDCSERFPARAFFVLLDVSTNLIGEEARQRWRRVLNTPQLTDLNMSETFLTVRFFRML